MLISNIPAATLYAITGAAGNGGVLDTAATDPPGDACPIELGVLLSRLFCLR